MRIQYVFTTNDPRLSPSTRNDVSTRELLNHARLRYTTYRQYSEQLPGVKVITVDAVRDVLGGGFHLE